ncbi:hypothetical protein VSDG_03328 [Cytospora chrysosperma]|uniref:Uncharacterized protein n=1 Tax=Cytospora chrysosperma TaxID=252740 RepID=A0A423WBG2_CYTCH|nr:hypothetical protein VSDG_03328 [Valsa sordida]
MCRMVIFSGKCIRCGQPYTLPELEQSVSCLEAKNNGGFGGCRRGVNMDQHDPAIECSSCSYALSLTEAYADSDDLVPASAGCSAGGGGGGGGGGGSSRGGGHAHSRSSYDATKRRRVR